MTFDAHAALRTAQNITIDPTIRANAAVSVFNYLTTAPAGAETLRQIERLALLTPPYLDLLCDLATLAANQDAPELSRKILQHALTFEPDLKRMTKPERLGAWDIPAGPAALTVARDALQDYGVVVLRNDTDGSWARSCAQLWAPSLLASGADVALISDIAPMVQTPRQILTPFVLRMITPFCYRDPRLNRPASVLRRTPCDAVEQPLERELIALRRRSLTVWTPLTASGKNAPGLEIGFGRRKILDAAAPQQLRPLVLAPGDVAITLGSTWRRMITTPSMTDASLFFEIRID